MRTAYRPGSVSETNNKCQIKFKLLQNTHVAEEGDAFPTEGLPNGEDRPCERRPRRRGELAAAVRAYAAANPDLTQTQISKRFGVSQPRISVILRRSHAGCC